jgi:hypothetical protein
VLIDFSDLALVGLGALLRFLEGLGQVLDLAVDLADLSANELLGRTSGGAAERQSDDW